MKIIINVVVYSAFFINVYEKGGTLMKMIFNLGNGAVWGNSR
nr:MAG TPA: hypothetical protein [Caudoviricetes sp.]